jgi:hypothetical protein
MKSGFEDTGTLAEVVPLAPVRDTREAARGLAAMTSNPPVRGDQDVTIDDVRAEIGERWRVAAIAGGYRAAPRGVRGTPIPRYGRTAAELLESIRHVERQP